MAGVTATAQDRLLLPFDARQHSRMRVCLESGEYVAVILERGKPLRDGELLLGNDGRVIQVVAAPEAVLHVSFATPLALIRAAYHLGNRHLSVQIGADFLRTPEDSVVVDLLAGLGGAITRVVEPFEPEGGAYASPHVVNEAL